MKILKTPIIRKICNKSSLNLINKIITKLEATINKEFKTLFAATIRDRYLFSDRCCIIA